MALARQQGNQALQDRCVEVMSAHRKNDVFAVLDFALRFNLRSLQGSCLGSLRHASRNRLVDKADRIMQVCVHVCVRVCVDHAHRHCLGLKRLTHMAFVSEAAMLGCV